MDYLHALRYAARRKSPRDLRAQLIQAEEAVRNSTTAKQRRRLMRRIELLQYELRLAEEFATYDWERGEREFVGWVGEAIDRPGVLQRWRSHGVPLRVLREAREARRAG